MKEIALHILDIAQNSISAGATLIRMEINETAEDNMIIKIKDNGRGMDKEMVRNVCDPYCTTRTTRNVGLGIPLFKHSAEVAGGGLTITSEPGHGTEIIARFSINHPDRQPVGDIAGVVSLLAGANPGIDFTYCHSIGASKYVFDTREVKGILEDVPISEPSVIRYIKEMIMENLRVLAITV